MPGGLAARAELRWRHLHGIFAETTLSAFILHDPDPRALSPRARGLVQAQSWQQGLTLVEMI